MVFLMYGALLATVGTVPVLLARASVSRIAITWVVEFVLMATVSWFFPFQMVGPLGGASLHSLALVALTVTFFGNGLIADLDPDGYRSARVVGFAGVLLVGTAAIFGIIALVTTSGIFNAEAYRGLAAEGIEEGTWSTDVGALDPTHLRQVPLAQATWKGNKALSQVEGGSLGSRYKIGVYHIQKFKGELMWIAPLEYQGFTIWQSAGYTPGFVMVSAEDANREPVLVSDRKFRFLESAYWQENLWRHVVSNGYLLGGLTDPTFEVDDDGNPFIVYTRYDLAIGYSGSVPVGALLVNPETGEMTEYALADVPAWVDRIMPETEAYARLVWYGEFVTGWINSWYGTADVTRPTDEDMTLVWTDDGRACWFTGMTSAADTDSALVSIVLMDSRTGRVREYRVDGAADEKDVAGAVKSAVSNYKDWVPTPAIPENVYGNLAWIVPVVNGDGVPQRIAIVSADASKVALGENVKQALAEFRRKMSESGERVVAGDTGTEESVAAIVDRFAADVRGGNTTYLFTLAGDARVFTGTGDVSPELPLTRVGDEVSVGFLETEETTVPVQRFDNLAIATRDPTQEKRLEEIGKSLYAPQPQ